MSSSLKIPIKNIYYMLCYGWDILEEKDNIRTGEEEFDNIYNLLGKIYIKRVNSLIKRGVKKEYIEQTEAIGIIKGKINVQQTINGQYLQKGKIVCTYDEFSENIKLNQIIKTTINILIKAPKLDKETRDELLKVRIYFSNIEEITLSNRLFGTPTYNKNDSNYKMLINISELIYNGLIANEDGNKLVFSDFIKENKMPTLYEKFVLNFYKEHLDNKTYKVHAPIIKWKIDNDMSEEDRSLLPQMRTDIVIENKEKNTQLIIDTKYYLKTLVTNNKGDKEKVRTSHLFQMFAYINNSKFQGHIDGLLLYPTVNKEIDINFPIDGKNIKVTTLNLNGDFKEIKNKLLSIVD